MSDHIKIKNIQAYVYRVPLTKPVKSQYLKLESRPALFVSVTDENGLHGWGEVWCNFPEYGAEHRSKLITTLVNPVLKNFEYSHPREVYEKLIDVLDLYAIQSGEIGTFAQIISGIDIAVWDLAARRARLPLASFINSSSELIVNCYASALDVNNAGEATAALVEAGHRAFKLKVGFGKEMDRKNLKQIRGAAGSESLVFVDANQRWAHADEAASKINEISDFDIGFVEEPLNAHSSNEEWSTLSRLTSVPLAGGENIMGNKEFERYINKKLVNHLQIDVAKWGGISQGLIHAGMAQKNNMTVTPHYLGGGIGLLASSHFLAAIGGKGFQEFDANDNPLRQFTTDGLKIHEGKLQLPNNPGIGVEPELNRISRYLIS